MKKFFLLAGLALSLGAATASAQVRINVNIGNPMPVMQQSWYGNDCDYYYMPDQGVYYNVSRRMYVWPNAGNWMCGPSLPPSYGNCTWGNSRYYAFRGRSPFMRHDYYRNYYGSRGGGRPGYAYGNGRGPGGRWDDRRGDGRWDNRGGGGRGWQGDRGGDRNWGNGGAYNNGNNGGGYNNGNGGYNGNNGGGYNGNGGNGPGNGGGGRGGWDRR